jgi:hypothetical protein
MLGRGKGGETGGQVGAAGAAGHDETSQGGKPAVVGAQDGFDFAAALDQSLSEAHFASQLRTELANDPAQQRTVSPGRCGLGEL